MHNFVDPLGHGHYALGFETLIAVYNVYKRMTRGLTFKLSYVAETQKYHNVSIMAIKSKWPMSDVLSMRRCSIHDASL
jgi:hypothetical protein